MGNKKDLKQELFENMDTGMLFTVVQYTSLQVKLKEQFLDNNVHWESIDIFTLKYKKIN